LTHFLERLRRNNITKEELQRLDLETVKEYYNLGLIGYVRQVDYSGKMRQFFNPPATYNYRLKKPLPDTDYLVVHSAMDNLLLEKHTYKNFYNKYNIIGDGYDFFPKIDNQILSNEHYLPRDLSGNRMNASNESAGHNFPLKEIYENFFMFDEVPRRHDKLMAHWNDAGEILGLLGRICYCHLLKKHFNDEMYTDKKLDYLFELERLPLKRKYNAELPDSQSEYALDRFLDKLIGRYITLGCYLVLDMRIEWTHKLLLTGKFDFQTQNNKDAVFSYLSRSFFIKDLRKEEPRNPKSHEHRQQKQRIYSNLSAFEQNEIRSFIQYASDEVDYLDWIKDENHKNWLVNEVLPRLWQPE
jgi:hypothetical protein